MFFNSIKHWICSRICDKRKIPSSIFVSKKRGHSLFINTYDIDGVCFINDKIGGIYPGPNDVIITGRSIDEAPETDAMLAARDIHNVVFYQRVPFEQKTRVGSGRHKATIINTLILSGYQIGCHFEDDEIQAAEIRSLCRGRVPVIMVVHDLTNKENVRHKDLLT